MQDFNLTINSSSTELMGATSYSSNSDFRSWQNPAIKIPAGERWEVALQEITYPRSWPQSFETTQFITESFYNFGGLPTRHPVLITVSQPNQSISIYKTMQKIFLSILNGRIWQDPAIRLSQPRVAVHKLCLFSYDESTQRISLLPSVEVKK